MKEQISPLVKKLMEIEPETNTAEMIRRDRDADEEARLDRLFENSLAEQEQMMKEDMEEYRSMVWQGLH